MAIGEARGVPAEYTFSGHHEGSGEYVLEIGTSSLPPGEHTFWIVYGQGKALLVPLLIIR